MKLELNLTGKYQRIPLSQNHDNEEIKLTDWMQSLSIIAKENHLKSSQLVQEKFALDFIPLNLVNQLLENNEILNLQNTIPRQYKYQFLSENIELNLSPDETQIPDYWEKRETEKTGNYQIIITQNSRSQIPEIYLKYLWEKSEELWQNYQDVDIIYLVISTPKGNDIKLNFPDNSHFKIIVENTDFSQDVKEVVNYLQNQKTKLSEIEQKILQEYQEKYCPPNSFQLPEELVIQSNITNNHQLVIGKRKSRNFIEKIIQESETFLLLSSYIIEDKSITELICQKATTLPQGVWILTDLRDDVINRLDKQTETNTNLPENHQKTDEKKLKCLTKLLDVGVKIRGGLFHLKTYISEKSGYLGSCNLTGGSLDFNLESGIISQNSPIHEDLIEYFRYFWNYKTEYDIIPSDIFGDFIQRSLSHSVLPLFPDSKNLLTPNKYYQDLKTELSNFTGKVQIYTRNFQPEGLVNLLNSRNTTVYLHHFPHRNISKIKQILNSNIHAKVTILGDKIAYIGGVNFQFDEDSLQLNDLMCKTTNPEIIKQIYQQLFIFS